MQAEAQRVLDYQRREGYSVVECNLMGFEGLRAGGCFFGRSKQGVMVRLSGNVAASEWANFYPYLSNVTRIDLAVTVKCDRESSGLSFMHWNEALEYQKTTAPNMRVVHIDGGKHGSTLLLGSRQSDGYARIYDKYLESKLDQFKNCWRYEVEFKKKLACEVAYRIALAPEDQTTVTRIVHDWFSRRRVVPTFSAGAISRTRLHRGVTDVDRTLTWIYTQVGPAVRNLIERGYAKQVEAALFGSNATQATEHDDARLRHRWTTEERGGVWERQE